VVELVADQAPAEAVAVRVCTGVPDADAPGYTLIVTGVESPDAVPAEPENVGVLLLTVDPLAGLVKVTIGAVVSTVKVVGVLVPVLPAASL
jgi:hypothetical protein